MAEMLVDDPRKKLYSALVSSSDKELSGQIKKFSYNKFNSLLDNNDFVQDLFMDISERGVVLDPKNPEASKDPYQFVNTFVAQAPPAPKPQAAPKQEFMEVPALEEQEAYVPEPQPLVGSPEYDKQLQKQYGGMAPTLGATFGGVPAAFETKEQKKQEQLSPAFKAQQLAFEDVPIAEEQRRAQKQFAKATKQQQQAALRGGTGFELQQERANEARESTQKLKDFGSYIGATFDNMIDKAKGAERIFAAKQKALLTFGDRRKKAEEEEKRVKQQIVNYVDKLDADFAAKQTDYNIEGNLFDAIRKGQWDRIPEAFAYNLAQIGVQALAATSTGGYSMFAQVFPDMYKAGVEEIAKKTKTTPEQVIASGNDKELLSYIGGGINGYIEYLSGGILGKAMRSEGAYKFLRDKALEKIGKTKWKQAAASAAALGGVSGIEGLTEVGQGLTEVITPQIAAADTFKGARENIYRELQKPETQRRLASEFVGGAAGGGGIAAGGRALSRTLEGDFTYGDVRKAPQRADYDVVQTDNKIQERNKIAQAMEEAVKANPEAEGQIRQQYQKRINEAAPTDEEVLSAYDGLAVLPETEEKNTIRENLEAYMVEKGIQPEPTGMEAGLGEGLRVTSPVIQTVNADFPPPQPPTSEEEVAIEEAPAEEELSLEDQLMGLVPQEETAPAPAEEVAPAEEEVATEEIAEEPTPLKDGDFVIVNGEKGVVTISPGGQISVETDTKIYDLDERGLAGIGGKLVTPKEQTQTEYEVEVIDDDNAVVNGEPYKIIRDEKGNTIALQGETRTIRTEPVMVDVDIKRNKAQVTETLQEQAEEVESLSPDMTLDKQKFVDDIIGQNMTEGVDRILSEGVTEKTAEKDLLQFKLFVEATIADLRARQKGNPYADAMIEQLQEALNTVYYEYYSQGRKAETRAAKTQKKTDRGTKGKERVSPKPAEGKQPTTPVTPPAAPKKEAAPKPEPKKEAPKPEPKKETPKEEKPVSGTPQEGDKVEIAPQREGGSPRNMVFKDGEWKQNVGGDIVKVGPAVQQQAQEAFGGKAEVKPAETKEGKKAEAKEEKVTPASKPQEAAVEIAKAFTDRFGIKVNLIDSKGLQDLLSKSENAKEFFFKVLDKIDVFETDNIQEAKNFITTVFQTVESAEDAKRAYRKLAVKYHPDKRGSEEVMKHLNDVNEKYQKGTLGRGAAQQERPSQATKEQRYREWAERMSRQYEADARAYAESSQMGDEQRAREAAKAQAEKEAREARAKAAQPTQKETKAEQPKPKPAQPTSKIKKGIIESLVEFFTKPFGAEKTTKGEVLTFESRSKYKQDAWNKRNSLKEENRKNELNRINENLKNYTSDRITTKQYRDNEAAIRSEYANKNKAVDDWYNNTVAAIDKAYEKKIPFAYKQYVGDKVAGLYDPVSLQAYVVLDNLDETTFVHEAFSHPFIEAVKERNNELYNNLLAESKNTQEIVDYVDENYGNAPQQVKDAEYIARAIDLDAKGKLKNKTLIEYVRQFWAEANKIFKDIFGGKGAAIENISPTTKVSDIVDFVLTSGERLDLTKPSTPSFTSSQSSEAATAFDKAKTSKGFDKKYGKGAYKALSDITKNFDEIMDKVSDKIKQDCL
jgi:hypothetical protein